MNLYIIITWMEEDIAMNVIEAIKTRRSIGRVKQDAVAREIIEEIIEAACWAPSHFNTQPWTFIVMTGAGREKLGGGYARVAKAKANDITEEQLEKERAKALRSPVVIAAVCTPSGDKRATLVEELAATQAAVQNLLLAAHAKGLGAIWRSGDPIYHPLMKEAFGLNAEQQLVGLIYIGYPDVTPASGHRSAASEKTIWLEQ